MTKKEEKYVKTMQALTKLHDAAKSKIAALIQEGTLTVDMLDFEYDGDTEEIEVKHTFVYPDGSKSVGTKTYYIEFSVRISEDM